MNIKLSNKLKELRFFKDRISQDDLARELQVSRQTINAIENGKFNPSVKLALQMAKFFECNIEDIFYIKEEK